jgi:superfamily II DNA/RNA helicase
MALKNPSRQTLILAPTRELAIQIESELRLLSGGLKIFFTTCVGGMPIGPQIKALRRDHNFIIGTPGRVIDLIERKRIFPGRINTVVLDEADRMLDMGFVNDMRKILSEVPTGGEKLFFSATMPKEALAIVHAFLRDPVTISVKKKDVIDSIEQNVVVCNADTKFDSLVQILSNPECTRVIVFGTMKHAVEALSRKLSHYNIQAESIHGNKNHNQRQRSLARFKSGNARVLVATDVAARGIHVDDVSHVINYDLPRTFEDYVHRIGRTGRSSKKGKALTFVPR